MRALSLLEVLDDAATLRRLVEARNVLRPQYTDTLRTVLDAGDAAWTSFVETSPARDLPGALAALGELSHATTGALALHGLVGELLGVERRLEGSLQAGADAMARLIDVARADVPDALIGEEQRALFADLRAADADASRLTRGMAATHRALDVTAAQATLQRMNRLRLRACLAHVLVRLAAASSSPPSDPAELTAAALDAAKTATTALRDAALAAAQEIGDSVVPPVVSHRLWGALYAFETFIESSGAEQLATAMSAAYHGRADLAANFSAMRKAGQAFDALTRGLAYDAGVRAILTAVAVNDADVLRAFANTPSLPLGSATVDLPRSSLASVATAPSGEVVEIDGVIQDAEFVEGGPSPRSVLVLGTGVGATVTVLVPFSSVDSFGLIRGVWVQVRGTVFAEGKDGVDGPLVQVRRIRLREAQEESATDRLIWLGRDLFAYRPGGYDIVSGRPAGTHEAMAQLDLRQGDS